MFPNETFVCVLQLWLEPKWSEFDSYDPTFSIKSELNEFVYQKLIRNYSNFNIIKFLNLNCQAFAKND